MTRKKVQLAYITNESARKATYKKRKNGLVKKVHEISTLCGVDACVIIYSPYDAQPVIWPPSDIEVQRVLSEFRSMPEMDQSKKMVNQETFLRERIVKIKDQMKKLIKDNTEKEMVEVMFQCLLGKDMSNMSMMEFNDLCWLIDSFMRDINMAQEKLMRDGRNAVQTTLAGPNLVIDTKPPIHSVNPNMVINPDIRPGVPHAFEAMQNQTNWYVNYGGMSSNNVMRPPPPDQFNMGGFVFNSGAGASSSTCNPHLGRPGVINDMMMPPTQFNLGGFVTSSGVGASSSNNPPSRLPQVSNDEMPPPPPPFNLEDVLPRQP